MCDFLPTIRFPIPLHSLKFGHRFFSFMTFELLGRIAIFPGFIVVKNGTVRFGKSDFTLLFDSILIKIFKIIVCAYISKKLFKKITFSFSIALIIIRFLRKNENTIK